MALAQCFNVLICALLHLILKKLPCLTLTFTLYFLKAPLRFPLLPHYPHQSLLCEVTISSSEVFEVLSALDTSKAMGVDGIGPLILKECAHVLFKPIHHLFSLSLSHQSIPVEWRTHFITPIHKSGTRYLVNNYRPISLLRIISKVLERIIYNHITVFVTGSLSSIQFGFLKNRSTVKQLLIFLNSVHQSLNNKAQTDVIYLDFSKAFDSVPR